jgi:hypothetical protein
MTISPGTKRFADNWFAHVYGFPPSELLDKYETERKNADAARKNADAERKNAIINLHMNFHLTESQIAQALSLELEFVNKVIKSAKKKAKKS